jgi:hypothetical protein
MEREKVHIESELQEVAPQLVHLSGNHHWQIPSGYFDQLPDRLMWKIRGKKVQAASIPEGYFEHLPNRILQRIRTESSKEIRQEELPQWLLDLRTKPTYQVPADYFEEVRLPIRSQAKVVAMSARRVWGYVAAAVVTGLLVWGGWMQLDAGEQANMDIASEVKQISDDGLEEYLWEPNEYLVSSKLMLDGPGIPQMDASVALLTDDELEYYLDKDPYNTSESF